MRKNGMLDNINSGIWLSAATCFMLFLYAPLELLFTNQDEFWFDAYILVPIMFVAFAAACVVSILILTALNRISGKLYDIVLWLYFAVYLCLYVQGNLLIEGLPPLNGERPDWSLYTDERIQSILLWGGALAAVFIAEISGRLKEIRHRIVKIVSICMTLMLCVTLLTLAVENDGFSKKPNLCATTKNMFQMSRNENLVILLLDAVDAQVMENMLRETPEYQDIFTDFTFYENTTGAYLYTKCSIPYILTGQWYENETDFDEYELQAYAASPLLKFLQESGYRMGLYEDCYEEDYLPLDDDKLSIFENVLENKRGVSDRWAFARWQILMMGFKYAPYDLKRFSFVDPAAFVSLKNSPNGEKVFVSGNGEFYDGVLHEEISYTEDRCFRFIHIGGGHVPFVYNEDVEFIPEEMGSYEDNLKACLTITKTYLQKLKDAGVYNNSVILVMADHGYDTDNEGVFAQLDPILFVKGINEKHHFSRSDAPVSFEDLQKAYGKLLNGVQSSQIFDWKSGDARERRFLYYEYLREEQMAEYIQTGSAGDLETIYATGRTYER